MSRRTRVGGRAAHPEEQVHGGAGAAVGVVARALRRGGGARAHRAPHLQRGRGRRADAAAAAAGSRRHQPPALQQGHSLQVELPYEFTATPTRRPDGAVEPATSCLQADHVPDVQVIGADRRTRGLCCIRSLPKIDATPSARLALLLRTFAATCQLHTGRAISKRHTLGLVEMSRSNRMLVRPIRIECQVILFKDDAR